MTKPLSMEKKKEIINYLENHTWKETSNQFNISEMTISRIQNELNTNKLTSTNNHIDLLNDLKFLMDFFQVNSKILQESNKNFFKTNIERFRNIANKLEEVEVNND